MGSRNYNSPLIRPPLRTVTGWGNDPRSKALELFGFGALLLHELLKAIVVSNILARALSKWSMEARVRV